MINKIYFFLIFLLWMDIFLVITVINDTNMLGISGLYLTLSVVVLVTTLIKKPYLNDSFKWFRFSTIFIYAIFGLFLSLDMIAGNSYDKLYPQESTMVLFGSLITLSSIYLYIKCDSNLFKHISILIIFLLSTLTYLDHALVYIFYSADDIIRPLYCAISLLGISIYIYFCTNYTKYLNQKKIKNLYVGIIFLYLLLCIVLLKLFIFDIPKDFETSVSLSISLIAFSILFNIYCMKSILLSNNQNS